MIRELSFTPASRLISDSARSPTCAEMLIAAPNRITPHGYHLNPSCAAGRSTSVENHQATKMPVASPPSAPSTVFPGLTDGMSFLRPINRPTAYAPLSDAHVVSRGSITSSAPDGTRKPPAHVSWASANAYG